MVVSPAGLVRYPGGPRRRRAVRGAGSGALAAAGGALLWACLGGCAATTPVATPPITWQPGNARPLVLGWQQYFEILWGVTRQDPDALIEGYITNTWGFAVREVRVLVNGYDASGVQTGQLIAWGPNDIQPGERVYFDVTVPAGAAAYDVSVFSWRWKWPPSGGRGVTTAVARPPADR